MSKQNSYLSECNKNTIANKQYVMCTRIRQWYFSHVRVHIHVTMHYHFFYMFIMFMLITKFQVPFPYNQLN